MPGQQRKPTFPREFFEHIRDAFLILDSDMRVVLANSAYRKLTGQADQQIVGQKFDSIRNRFHSECIAQELQKAFTRAKNFILEDYNIANRIWLEYHTSPHPSGLAVLILDITARKELELQVALQNEQSSLLLERLSGGVARLGLNGRWLSQNSYCTRLTGFSPPSLTGRYFWELFADKNVPSDQEELKKLLTGESDEFISEKKIRRSDGSEIWASIKITLVKDAVDKPLFFALALNESDEKKRTEERLNFVLETTKLGSWEYDPNTDSTLRSEKFDELFCDGEIRERWGYRDFIDHIHPTERAIASKKLLASIRRGKDLHFEGRIISTQGRERWVSLTAKAQKNSNSDIYVLTGTVADITEKKQAEQDLILARLAAEDAGREKNYFLANISHEMRTPLGTILGFTEMLKDLDLKPEDREEYLQIVLRSGRSLASLIDHILDLSKVDSGYLDIDIQDVDVMELLSEVKNQLQPQADAKGLKFCFTTINQQYVKVKTDPIRLRQILLNVIGNAIKFTDSGYVRVGTIFMPPQDGDEKSINITFSVSDSGVGLTRAETSKLFQPFSQGDNSSTRKYGGLGLGLALSRRLARALGGDLVLESSVKGQGSTFSLRIRAEVPQDALVKKEKLPAKPQLNSPPDLRGVKILVADDSPENQRLFKHLLLKMGASIDLADNGVKAVKMATSQKYDLVLMDMQMPELDGYEATSELRRRGVKLPVIALTAHAMRHDRDKCMSSGCTEYLSKPVEPGRLFSMVQQFVQSPQQPNA